MAIHIELPANLASLTGVKVAQLPPGPKTVGEALAQLVEEYPALKSELFEPEGGLDWAYIVLINGVAIPRERCLETTLNDGDQLSLLGVAVLGGGM